MKWQTVKRTVVNLDSGVTSALPRTNCLVRVCQDTSSKNEETNTAKSRQMGCLGTRVFAHECSGWLISDMDRSKLKKRRSQAQLSGGRGEKEVGWRGGRGPTTARERSTTLSKSSRPNHTAINLPIRVSILLDL